MNEPPFETETAQAAPTRGDWGALSMGLLLLLEASVLLTGAPILAMLGLSGLATVNASDALSLLMLAAGSFGLGMLLVPGVAFNTRKFFNLPEPDFRLPVMPLPPAIAALAVLWVITLALGFGISANPTLEMVCLPWLNIAAVFLPVGILLLISLGNLPMPSLRRGWSIFGASTVLAPFLTIIFEMFAFGGFMLFFALYASSTPGLDTIFRNLVEELQNKTVSLDFITQEAAGLLLAPGTVLALLGLFSLAIPIIEEALKVTLLWFYAGRLRSPVEGFVLGILCGAAFALAENIGFASTGSADWLANVFSRATAALPHMFNSGLMGWALVSAWQERRYTRLALAYVAAILVHGAWNALSIALALSSFSSFSVVPAVIETPIPAAMSWGVMALELVLGLFLANAQMRKQAAREAAQNVGYNPPLSS